MSLGGKSLEELGARLAAREISPQELALDCLDAAHEAQPRLGAFQELFELASVSSGEVASTPSGES